MLRNFSIVTVLCLTMCLGACSNPKETINLAQFDQQIRALNWFSAGSPNTDVEKVMPFDDAYLSRRHALLENLDYTELSRENKHTYAYLKIQQRYPERFLIWPAQINVLESAVKHFSQQEIDAWLSLAKLTLQTGRDSKILLSRIEKAQILSYLESTSYNSKAARELAHYLHTYNTRSGIGLYQHPNGKEWYQSKINYYTDGVYAPYELADMLSQTTQKVSEPIRLNWQANEELISQPMALNLLGDKCEPVAGMNWRDLFINIRKTVLECGTVLSKEQLSVAATLAEVDIGVHMFAWSQQQAMHRLQSRLVIDEAQAYALLKNIVLFPATTLVYLPHFKRL
ncbi:hypothetical protein [Pseudoalteromonas luteoviolacea]|uniref:Lipoprotein n=1 Tax=Pseudoalteromonas luteoviolacea (strain 2ta16) TaxID=1353533 RepID=V4J4Q7_PSEL2|nr:hypothetical protein [Pseudoalteromonas luteoviolacea]ESP90322.1 hypothetical protein PL2TA16_02009 [Pseudoalteromonas luteoviolacea 2ta16]KZN39902.1 hypothetical protein N483_18780 [Pseudoalteromonas luteoviolacea NCIMB 1944]